MRSPRTAFLSAALLVLLQACASGTPAPPSDTTTTQPATTTTTTTTTVPTPDPQTFVIQVDGHTTANQGQFDTYFPTDFEVHPGDTIEFVLVDSGEAHTVTFGTRATEAVQQARSRPAEEVSNPGAFLGSMRLPMLVTQELSIQHAAANQCVSREGDTEPQCEPPGTDVVFDGDEEIVNSGILLPDRPFRVTFADDIEPGEYGYICLLHGAVMVGMVTVVPHGTPTTSPDVVAAAGHDHHGELEVALAGFVVEDEAFAADEDNLVMGGSWRAELPQARGVAFVPEAITIEVGETVRWMITSPDPHTVTFNWTEDHVDGFIVAAGERPSVNPLAFFANPHKDPPVVFGRRSEGPWDGTGVLNSGLIFGTGFYDVTFTEPGTYRYRCLLHHDMEGVVNVVG